MTIHGSKGLSSRGPHGGREPGLHPRRYPSLEVPAAERHGHGWAGSPDEIARAAHNEEQECLFYVAMSRARDRLAFYGATAKSTAAARPLSKFLDRIGAVKQRPVTPSTVLPPAPDVAHIRWSSPVRRASAPRQLPSMSRAGGGFLYTHLLQVGGRRR
jgi:ATP-dependent exoDNAse (exonuclease V) beta subunit